MRYCRYDNQAIFTGSATVVNGKPYIVYPGLCDKSHPGCVTYADYAIAVPSNASDPLYANWSKPDFNPIINGTSDDPSTAWQTPHGEWRLIGNSPAVGQKNHEVAPIFAAPSFEGPWKLVGDQDGFNAGECPSFFPLPALYPGTSAANGDPLPTHVHKRGHGSPGCDGDCMQIGTYVDGKPGEVGSWTATPGVPFDEVRIDHGSYYASKDFWDPVAKRRINWGWATISGGSQSLPREIRYHAELKQLVYSPVAELASLHGASPLADDSGVMLKSGVPHTLLASASGSGSVADINVSFTVPTTPTTLSVNFFGGMYHATINFVPGTNTAAVSAGRGAVQPGPAPQTANIGRMMEGTDMSGGDYSVVHHPASFNASSCQALCDAASKCKAWVWVVRGQPAGSGDCCLKSVVPCPRKTGGSTMFAGGKVAGTAESCLPTGGGGGGGGGVQDTLQLSSADKTFEVRVFADQTVVEVYFMDGRVAMTMSGPTQVANGSVSVLANSTAGSATTFSGSVYEMNGIWVSPEEVLATPRRDRGLSS